MDQIIRLLANGEEIVDVDEESFLLFAQDIPSNNLGMLNPRAPSVEISINGNEYTIHQSPSLLSSHRAGGTTGAGKYKIPGTLHKPAHDLHQLLYDLSPESPEARIPSTDFSAVLWKITPLFAEWITNPSNPLWTTSLLSQTSTVAELGTGISALVALVLAPSVRHYIATDQEYVRKLFRTNLDANASVTTSHSNRNSKGSGKSKGSKSKQTLTAKSVNNISFTTLDWETDQAASLKECMDSDDAHGQDAEEEGEDDKGFDLLLSCDCIYNEALVAPFVRTCAEICRLRPAYVGSSEEPRSRRKPTVCIIAQQQRSPDVFETWLRETMREFGVWRLSDDVLGEGLRSGSGYLVHLLLAREK
ncbi:hypothetical protein PDIG_30360 [Penicillium digitatum PHI26]|uniref:Diaminohydroxyphosphoribosylamino-pyrimidine deaminase n=2 Tax=Penicillium digitatum TaxID=36651 RepID=K9G244_PEND2|nr:hypothetical protein PDIP_64740 [Penicillium digitatum Pd1]EKV09392.1 hypothetical protein PDIP_64740 [Penicillium digitatum Pd1]EKV14957.1 hypothetical protein PDIG_30360 [Penicillium digitatum PHI26]KAG0157015.1 hypothetical protein PDIDSM_4198 [Penicillium digitatum]